ncbi:MAG: hypothetical protein ACLVGP_02775 [Oscillospiraceae bacterium]
MEVPVCLEKRRVGTLAVTPSGTDTVFRVRCTGLPAGLYRLYVCGDGGELLLGVTEDGCLHRRFSAAMTTPLGAVTWCRAQPVQGAAWRALAPSDGLPWPVPAGALLRREGASAQVAVPWPQDAPFPLTELFCFASVGQREEKRYVFFVFSGGWTPVMPRKP